MFIVEGADFVGKTAFLAAARSQITRAKWPRWYGRDVVKVLEHRPPSALDVADYVRAARKGPRLANRFALSELAFDLANRPEARPFADSHARRLIARELNRAGSVQLLLRSNRLDVDRRMVQAGVLNVGHELNLHVKMNAGYDRALEDLALGRRGVPYLSEVDTSDGNEETVQQALSWALDVWRMHLDRSITVTKFAPHSWGYLWPRVLFVSHPESGDVDPVRPLGGEDGCSRTFSDLLDFAGIGERHLYLVNAYDRGGEELDPRAITWLSPRVVIALGEAASEYLRKEDAKHVPFPHPQHLRRFESKRLAEWADRLKAAVSCALMDCL